MRRAGTCSGAGVDDLGSHRQTISLGSRAPSELPARGRGDIGTSPDGALVVRPQHPLGPYPDKLTERLDYWAAHAPDRVFLGRARSATANGARPPTRRCALRLATWRKRCSSGRFPPIAPSRFFPATISSTPRSRLGAMYAGIPFAPISPAYSLVSSDFGKLRLIFDILTPGLVFVSAGAPFRKALEAMLPPRCRVGHQRRSGGLHATPFSVLETTAATSAVDHAHAAVGPDTIAKFLFTSGSTGTPKGVINTQRMLCSNQEIVRTMLPFVVDDPPVLCDWLPWNHTFAGNHDFGLVLYNGGSYYIDDGRPVAGAIEATIRNLDDVRPTIFLNVPARLRNGVCRFCATGANFAIVSSSGCGSCITRAPAFRSRSGTNCRSWPWNPAASAS